MTNLAVDIGNTRVKFGVFDDVRLINSGLWKGLKLDFVNRLVDTFGVDRIVVSPLVGHATDTLKNILSHDVLVFTENTPLPVRCTYQTPETLGRDRLAAVAGARSLFPDQTCLIMDAGTCITVEFLSADGTYPGGSIHPGIRMRLKAMHSYTDSLPLINTLDFPPVIGRNTTEAMQSGALHGVIQEMNGFIDWYKRAYDKVNVILTGGDHKILAKHLKSKIFVHSDLVLVGLNEILRYNEEHKA